MNRGSVYRSACAVAAAFISFTTPSVVEGATIYVPAGGNLQSAIDAARPGDTIILTPGATYIGNFKLPVHGGSDYITIRSAHHTQLPPDGARISPAHAPYLAKIKSPNTAAAIRTAAGAAYWRILLLEFEANSKGYNEIISLGDGSVAQNSLSLVPHHLVVDRVYMHGDRLVGQKRGIGLNGANVSVINSYIVEMKAADVDSQAISGWNGPGPFLIENNHLEGAGEVFMMGGDDPKIPDMTPEDMVFRRNTLTRPLSWRNPIVSMPTGVRASATLSGTLPAGTYAYRVTARRYAGNNVTAKSSASPQVSVTVATGSRVTVEWDAVPDATEYLVHGRTPGAQNVYWRVTSTSFTDDGTIAGAAGTPSSGATMWQVKNIFELKHMRGAVISGNIMENNWAQAQNGVAIVITPRNQGGRCPWCVVEDIKFEYNVVRHVGSGLTVLGWDDEKPSQQAKNVEILHNEFSDVSKAAWGGSGYAFNIIDGPYNVTIDHNTIISPSGNGILMADVAPAEMFKFRNNVARHNSYGMFGDGLGLGNAGISYYFPGAEIRRNVIAGGNPKYYPTDNLFPTLSEFEAHFTDYVGGDFTLKPGTDWERRGTDGLDLGADMAALAPPRVTTTTLPSTTEHSAYSVTLDVRGGRAPYEWNILGELPEGLTLDASAGVISGAAAAYGDYAFAVQVRDANGATGSQSFTLNVARYIAPVVVVTQGVAVATETLTYFQSLAAEGGLGTYTWSVTGGVLPNGLSLSAAGVISGTPIGVLSTKEPQTFSFTVTATDAVAASADGTTRQGSRTLSLTVVGAPNVAPTVVIAAPTKDAVVPVGSTITLAALPVDSDGIVARVDFYVNNAAVGTAVAPTFTLPWLVAMPGSHTVTAVAVDDDGASRSSTPVTIAASSEVVLRASQVARMVGNFALVVDTTAAGGYGLSNVNKGLAKVNVALAAPASYAEFTFYAEAGRPYHVWLRGRADRNDYANDSVHFQFDNVASAAIGSTSSLTMNLEDGANAGLAGWGWQDNGYGIGVLGAEITFSRTGLQTLRIQPREDGLMIDQIVLSPERYLTTAPGVLKNDPTILP